MNKDVIIACDFAGKEELFSFLQRFTDEKPFLAWNCSMQKVLALSKN